MPTRMTQIIAGFLGFALLATFVVGLSISISQGFAGFYGGLPFAIIVGFVLILAFYDFFTGCLKKKPSADAASAEHTEQP